MKNRIMGTWTLCLFLLVALVTPTLTAKEKVYLDGVLLDFMHSTDITHARENEFRSRHPSPVSPGHTVAAWYDAVREAQWADALNSYDFYDWKVQVGRVIYIGRYHEDKSAKLLGHHSYDAKDWPDNTPVQVRIERETWTGAGPIPILSMYIKKANSKGEIQTELVHIFGADGVDKCRKTTFRNFSRSGWTCIDAWKEKGK